MLFKCCELLLLGDTIKGRLFLFPEALYLKLRTRVHEVILQVMQAIGLSCQCTNFERILQRLFIILQKFLVCGKIHLVMRCIPGVFSRLYAE